MNIPVYEKEIKKLSQKLQKRFQPDCIILHGSIARGTQTLESDVDIIVVGGNLPENFFARSFELSQLRDGETPFEILSYKLEEWEEMMARFHLTTLEALQWGIPLHGEELFATWHERFSYWKSLGLSRGKVSWSIPPQLDSGMRSQKSSASPKM